MPSDAEIIGAIYDQHGEYYHKSRSSASGRLANEFIDMPAVLSLLPGQLTGLRVLNAGCGSGLYSAILAKRGASVLGIDASKKMIEIASRERPHDCDLSYSVDDIAAMRVPDASFDLVMCNYVLENISDIAGVFTEFHRVMKPGGFCIVSISHPLRAQAIREQRAGQEVWTLQDYFAHGERKSDFGGGMVVPKYKRPIEDYTEAVNAADLLIRRLLEPRPVPDGEAVDPDGYGKAVRLPQLLVIEATRIDG